MLHLGADDLDAFLERYRQQGIPASDPRPFQRPVDTPEGPRTMRARSLSFPPGANPEALVQVAQHLTPELVLQPRYMRYPNGAKALTEVIVCTTEPTALAAKYGRYAGRPSHYAGRLHLLNLGRSRITFVAPEHLGEIVPGCVPPSLPFLAGFTVAADMPAARRVLGRSGIAFGEHEGRLVVSPQDACGGAVLFEAKGTTRR